MTQEQREHQKHGDGESGDDEFEVSVTIRGNSRKIMVPQGTTLKGLLKHLEHQYGKGLIYRLNGRLLEVNEEDKLVDDEVLSQDDILLIEELFTGGV